MSKFTQSQINNLKKTLDKKFYGMEGLKRYLIRTISVKEPNVLYLRGEFGLDLLSRSIAEGLGKEYRRISLNSTVERCTTNDPVVFVQGNLTQNGYEEKEIENMVQKMLGSDKDPLILIEMFDEVVPADPDSIFVQISYRNNVSEYEHLVRIAQEKLVPKFCLQNKVNPSAVRFSDDLLYFILQQNSSPQLEQFFHALLSLLVEDGAYQMKSKNLQSIEMTEADLMKLMRHFRIPIDYSWKPLYDEYPSGIVRTLTCDGRKNLDVNSGSFPVKPAHIEVVNIPGVGQLEIHGADPKRILLGCSYVQSFLSHIDPKCNFFSHSKVIVNVPAGDDSSLAVAIAALSKALNIPIDCNEVLVLGEISLTGKILPMEQISEYYAGAKLLKVKKIFIPEGNREEFEGIESKDENIEVKFCDRFEDIFVALFCTEVNDEKSELESKEKCDAEKALDIPATFVEEGQKKVSASNET